EDLYHRAENFLRRVLGVHREPAHLANPAAAQGIDEQAALEMGMEVKSIEFVKSGAEVYRNV
ncbi:MAG: hypothetical protein GX576_10590, partial [Thauera phenolivorans]|nr:hypothetical protein [Thauera phenolivorans]